MDENLDKTIEIVINQIKAAAATSLKCDDALKYSQAILNLTHAKNVLEGTKLALDGKKKGGSTP